MKREYLRRNRSRLIIDRIREGLFDRQICFIEDPSKRKTAKCGRRAGKSHGAAAAYLIEEALKYPESLCVYIALSRKAARRILWPILKKFNRQYKIGASTNELELEMTFPNGSQIWLTGATDSSDIDKLRGNAYRIVIIDECASFGSFFHSLIEDVVEPALADYDGTLCLIGTPGAACAGFFYDATTGRMPGWSNHEWTILDNPKFPRWAGKKNWRRLAEQWLRGMREVKAWPESYPTFQREWLAQWIHDETWLVYRYAPDRNTYESIPIGKDWIRVLGVDLGLDDASAFVVLAYLPTDRTVYLIDDFSKSGMSIDEIAGKIKFFQQKYHCLRIVMDTAGLGKSIAFEIRKRYSLAIEPAEKKEKLAYIELLNSDLLLGRFKVHGDSEWASEATILQWDEDRKKEDVRFKNHVTDAALYAWRECQHFASREPVKDVEVDTPEYMKLQENEQKKREIQRAYLARKKKGKAWHGRAWAPTSTWDVLRKRARRQISTLSSRLRVGTAYRSSRSATSVLRCTQ